MTPVDPEGLNVPLHYVELPAELKPEPFWMIGRARRGEVNPENLAPLEHEVATALMVPVQLPLMGPDLPLAYTTHADATRVAEEMMRRRPDQLLWAVSSDADPLWQPGVLPKQKPDGA